MRSAVLKSIGPAVLGLTALAALALGGSAAAAVSPSCTWSPSPVTVSAGASVMVTITCSGVPGGRYTVRVTDAPSALAGGVTPGRAPNTFRLQLTAPAGARAAHVGVGLIIDGGASPAELTIPVTIRHLPTRRSTRRERDAEYRGRVCSGAPGRTSCRAGRGRRTIGGPGTGKVSHRNWPAITGVYLTFPGAGGGRLVGGELNDELLGHHGSDTIFGGPGSDVIWGDWDPVGNTSTQRDVLNGGNGTDFIYTSHGRNRVTGGAGNDFIWAFYGRGTIDCGPGIDKVRLRARRSAYRLRSCELRGRF